ncbi:hypothetical protein CT508_04795 [Campylobacter upsaliensis]|nr:hypothetical protein [Campylobacter upsaliensis]
MIYDIAKYETATPKQIVNALSLAKKRAEKLEEEMKNNKNFSKNLQKLLKNSFSTKKTKIEECKIPELDEAIKEYENGNVVTCRSMEEFKAKMAED